MPTIDVKTLYNPLIIGEDFKDSAAFAYAAAMAEAASAHLDVSVFAVKIEPPYTFAPAFVSSLAKPVNDRHQADLEAAAERLRRALPGAGVAAELKQALLSHDDILARAAHDGRLHDLAVVDAPREYFAAGRALVEELLFHTGRPAVVVPPEATAFQVRRVLVAWDGSACAARALGDAMPLLKGAEHVVIASAPREKDMSRLPAGAEVAPQLARRGIAAEAVELDAAADAAQALLDHARLIGADLIVMGAFAHARWRQFVLGGVTESMLARATLPVLMSH